MTMIPDAAAMEQIARRAIAQMPEMFRVHLDGVSVHVEEFADDETLDDLDIDSRWGLLGVYQGRPITEQSIWESGVLSPRIRLFRRPLLAEWEETGEDLHDLIVHVLVHEVGHHFGYSDEEMEEIDEGDD